MRRPMQHWTPSPTISPFAAFGPRRLEKGGGITYKWGQALEDSIGRFAPWHSRKGMQVRIAFVSDIHANLQAWNAVQADIAAQRIGKIVCLGDVVGYGPSPAEVLSKVYANVHFFVLGNHDAVVSGTMEPTGFNPHAKELIALTCQRLGAEAQAFFSKLPLCIRGNGFRCCHGNPAKPGLFAYVLKEKDARLAWQRTSEALTFVGHTHCPCLHELAEDGRYTELRPGEDPITLHPERRYILNCGSVGVSRDLDLRASYLIYDASGRSARWRRVAYDLEAFTHTVREAYGDTALTEFLLKRFDSTKQQPIRELLDFTPGRAAVSESVTAEQQIEQIEARVGRWRLAAVVIGLLFCLAAAGAYLVWRSRPTPQTLAAGEQAEAATPTGQAFSHEFVPDEAPPPGQVPPGWQVSLGDSRTQSVRFAAGQVLLSSSSPSGTLEVILPSMGLAGVGEVRFEARGEALRDHEGEAPSILADYAYEDGTLRCGVKQETIELDETELTASLTITDIPDDVWKLRVRLRARFSGQIALTTLRVTAVPKEKKPPEAAPDAEPIVNVNRAGVKELCTLPGIGDTKAQRIIDYRQKHGPFQSIDGLLRVKGIGEKTLTALRKRVRVD